MDITAKSKLIRDISIGVSVFQASYFDLVERIENFDTQYTCVSGVNHCIESHQSTDAGRVPLEMVRARGKSGQRIYSEGDFYEACVCLYAKRPDTLVGTEDFSRLEKGILEAQIDRQHGWNNLPTPPEGLTVSKIVLANGYHEMCIRYDISGKDPQKKINQGLPIIIEYINKLK